MVINPLVPIEVAVPYNNYKEYYCSFAQNFNTPYPKKATPMYASLKKITTVYLAHLGMSYA